MTPACARSMSLTGDWPRSAGSGFATASSTRHRARPPGGLSTRPAVIRASPAIRRSRWTPITSRSASRGIARRCSRGFVSEQQVRPELESSFEAYRLSALKTEQSWNLIPKALRIAAIGLVGMVAFKGVQAIIAPSVHPVPVELAEQSKQLIEQNKV